MFQFINNRGIKSLGSLVVAPKAVVHMVTEGRVWKPNHQNLWQAGALTPAMSLILQACVCANFNLLVSGTANSGTAELIEALCACIDGKMEPTPKSSLRSNRIIDACVNLDNAKLLQVMNNSFPGSILTICADSPASAIRRSIAQSGRLILFCPNSQSKNQSPMQFAWLSKSSACQTEFGELCTCQSLSGSPISETNTSYPIYFFSIKRPAPTLDPVCRQPFSTN